MEKDVRSTLMSSKFKMVLKILNMCNEKFLWLASISFKFKMFTLYSLLRNIGGGHEYLASFACLAAVQVVL